MSTAQEIKDAIRTLPEAEREKLIHDLPLILPELASDEWERIIADSRPRANLTALGNAIEAQMKSNPDVFPKIKESDFSASK